MSKTDDAYRRVCREKVVQHQRAEKAEAERDSYTEQLIRVLGMLELAIVDDEVDCGPDGKGAISISKALRDRFIVEIRQTLVLP